MPIIGFNNVHIGGEKDGEPYTNREILDYIEDKYGVRPRVSDIVRTGGCIRVAIHTDDEGPEDGLDFLTFEEWLRRVYGDPQPGDAFFKERQQFGYAVWLIKVHPDVFAETGKTKGQIYGEQRQLYNWYCIDAAASGTYEDPPETDEEALRTFLDGAAIAEVTREVLVCGVTPISPGSLGVALWEETDTSWFCIFPDANGELVPGVFGHDDVRLTLNTFEGWDSL